MRLIPSLLLLSSCLTAQLTIKAFHVGQFTRRRTTITTPSHPSSNHNILLRATAITTTTTTSPSSSSSSEDQKQKQENSASSSSKSEQPQQEEQQQRTDQEPCNVVFTHTNADFDSLAAAVALSLLWKHQNPSLPTHVVLPRGVNPVVQRFLAFHKQLLPLRGFKTILPEDVNAIGVVDAQSVNRIGRGKAWLDHANAISIFDHHDVHGSSGDDENEKENSNNNNNNNNQNEGGEGGGNDLLDMATEVVIDKVGSTTTLLVERLRDAGIVPAPHEATLFVLGIRADTGGLVYEGTTIRDAAALLWCLESGASQTAISEFGVNKVTEEQRLVLNDALSGTETNTVNGLRISSVLLRPSDQYVPGLAQVCEEVRELTDSDVLIMGATHRSGSGRKIKTKKKKQPQPQPQQQGNATTTPVPTAAPSTEWISLIGRASSRSAGVDLNAIMRQFQGGGHPKAAAATVRCQVPFHHSSSNTKTMHYEGTRLLEEYVALANQGKLEAEQALSTAVNMVEQQIPEQLTASNCMVPVETVSVDMTVAEARALFDSQGLTSAPVVDDDNRYKSSMKLNDLVKASRAGRSDAKLKGMVKPNVKTVMPDTTLADLEHLLIHEGVGRIPVVDDDGYFLGMVTRTDVLRQHKLYDE